MVGVNSQIVDLNKYMGYMCRLIVDQNLVVKEFVWEFGGEGKQRFWGEKFIEKLKIY